MDSNKDSGRGDLRAVLALLRRRLGVILIAVVITTGLAVAASQLQNKEYTATSNLLFKTLYLDAQVSGLPLQIPGDAARDAETNVRLVSLPEVRARTAEALGGGYTAANLKNRIDVKSDGQSNLVAVSAKASTADEAARIANTLGDQFVEARKDTIQSQIQVAITRVRSQLRRSGDQPAAIRRQLRVNLEKLRLLSSVQTADAQVVNRAGPPSSPSAPKPVRNAVFGAFAGLLIGLALALGAEQLDGRLRRTEQFEDALGLPVLASVPKSKALRKGKGWQDGLAGVEAEAFRRLRASLRYYGRDQEIRSVLLTSTQAESGKTTIGLHLASAAAAGGARVLLIEADLRRPRLSALLGLSDDAGLSTMLRDGARSGGNGAGAAGAPGFYAVKSSNEPGKKTDEEGHFDGSFEVLLAGPTPANASELLDSPKMREVIAGAHEHYDLTIIDGPPPGLVSDSIPLMKSVDGVIVVGRIGRESREQVEALRHEFARLDVRPVGAVANFARDLPKKNPYYAASG